MPSLYPRFILCRCSLRDSDATVVRSMATLLVAYFGVCVLLGVATFSQAPALASPEKGINDPALDARVDAILQNMTLEEKVGQLVQYSAGQPTGPGTGRSDYGEMIAKGQIGSLFNVIDPKQINMYQRIAMEKSRLHIPILFGLDVIHGFKTEFPIPLGLASTWDPTIIEKASHVAAMEAAADGIKWTFSPMVDIARDARWGRMAEGAGEDPFLGVGDGCRLCEGIPRLAIRCRGQHCILREAFCGLWRGRRWKRLQHYGNFRTYFAAVSLTAVSCGGGCRCRIAHERFQHPEWDAGIGESIHAEASPEKGMGL